MKRLIALLLAVLSFTTLFAQTKVSVGGTMVEIPDQDFMMLTTEVNQKMYKAIMGKNISRFVGDNLPVENISWYDAIVFCNKLSEKEKLVPVYAVNGIKDVKKWKYVAHKGNAIIGEITQDENANGYRLPTLEEWICAAKCGKKFKYSGSNDMDEVGWFNRNSGGRTHESCEKISNRYGLYDMSGNVWEFCWDPQGEGKRCIIGGGYNDNDELGKISGGYIIKASAGNPYYGFRIVRSIKK